MLKDFIQKNKNHISFSKSGFTLIETMVAISIFSLSILGLMSVLASGVSNTNYAKEKVIANYLAQEGLEYIINLRNTYALFGGANGWGDFWDKIRLCDNSVDADQACYFDPSSINYSNPIQPIILMTVSSCPSGICPSLYYTTTGKYNYDILGNDSGFIRKIQANQIGANQVKISSTVSWNQGSGLHSATFSEYLFNWIK